ncbi:MAG TPA: histidine--tRNA ligase [Bellilinea sp.]|nr:histidine--tRNA ligase [Bellilinea sp.]
MEKIIPSVKGTRDFYPEEMAVRLWLYYQIKTVSQSFGYQEYEGPILEKIDLYAAKSGEELVKEQAFVFPDRSGELITLRPELTPTVARMVAQRQKQLTYPVRWWSFGPFWRYEKPQKGRTREFFQWNIDIFGVNSAESDAELIAIAAAFFKQVGLSAHQVGIFLNDRRLMDQELQRLDLVDLAKKKAVFRLIDRRDKLRPDEWQAYAVQEIGLSENQFEQLKSLLDDENLWKKSPELTRVFQLLTAMGLGDYLHYSPEVIRGLEYYTGTVFEARDMDREGRAILGGGHYDNLVSDVGGDPLPGVGFAMGDVMVGLVLKKYGCIPELSLMPANVLVTVFSAELMEKSFSAANYLREAGIPTICFTEAVKLPKQFKYADRIGSRFVVVIGPDEAANGQVTLKDLSKGEQRTIEMDRLAEEIRHSQ